MTFIVKDVGKSSWLNTRSRSLFALITASMEGNRSFPFMAMVELLSKGRNLHAVRKPDVRLITPSNRSRSFNRHMLSMVVVGLVDRRLGWAGVQVDGTA